MKKIDNFFKFSFFFTLLVMIFLFSSNIEKRGKHTFFGGKREKIVLQKVNINQIKSLIQQGKLSDKEALFYRQIKE